MNKLLIISFSLVFLGGCSKINTYLQNNTGSQIEAYHSSKLKIICFQNTSSNGELWCMPDKEANINGIASEKWVVI